jgi:hypothetical protein
VVLVDHLRVVFHQVQVLLVELADVDFRLKKENRIIVKALKIEIPGSFG